MGSSPAIWHAAHDVARERTSRSFGIGASLVVVSLVFVEMHFGNRSKTASQAGDFDLGTGEVIIDAAQAVTSVRRRS